MNNPITTLTDALREMILEGRFAPGQRLIEADLCAEFATGRRQVKAAITALEFEGLVEQLPHRGARVRIVTPTEALHLSEARLALESLCLKRAASRMGEAAKNELSALCEDLRRAATADDRDGFARINGKITACYIALADQPVLAEMLMQIGDRNRRYSHRVSWTPGWLQKALPLRQALINALIACDGPAAVAALETHNTLWRAAMDALGQSH